MEKRLVYRYLAVFSVFVLLLVGLVFLRYYSLTGFSIFQQQGTEFNTGTYLNTSFNGSDIVLLSYLTGTYTSKIFDAGFESRWNSLSIEKQFQTKEYIYSVDNNADVWNSSNEGASWSLVKNDYNAGDGNGVTTSFFNSSGDYFIIYNQDVWLSQDSGLSWSKINNDYNGAEGQNAFVANVDKNNNLYIIEGDQDVWKSTDSGISWTKVSIDFNGGNGNFAGLVVNSSNSLIAVDLAADVWYSSNQGATWSLLKDDYNEGAGNNADDMAIDKNNNLYILNVQDVWKSSDSGVSWAKVNDDFNGAGDGENGFAIYADSNNYVYVIDGGEDVFKSTDSGVTFTKVATNFNAGNGNALTINSVLKTTNLTYQVRNCSVSDCSDGNWQEKDLTNLNLNGRYFQYKILFSSQDAGITPAVNSITLNYDILNTPPSVTLVLPQEGATYSYSKNISLNFSVSDNEGNLDSCWYNIDSGANISLPNCQNITFNTSVGNHILYLYVNDTQNAVSNKSVSFIASNSPPLIAIAKPGEGETYGYNTSLALDFSVSDVDGDINSCWHHIDSSDNFTIANCQNATFNVSEGSHVVYVYVNDSLGEQASNFSSFTVNVGAPSISLSSPINSYLNSNNVTFLYTPSDIDLQACELWGDFSGSFELNQTENSPLNNQANQFSLSLGDGTYKWNIKCNDTQGHTSINGNQTFYIDTTFPIITLTQPTGGKDSRNVTALWQVSDININSCSYNVYRGSNIEITNTNVLCHENTTQFTVTLDADFVFNFYADDKAGNSKSESLSFNVATGAVTSEEAGTTTGSSAGSIVEGSSQPGRLDLSNIEDIIIKPGDSKTLSVTVKNTGSVFLNKCKLEGNLISSNVVKGLAIGQQEDFVFVLNVPRDFVDEETVKLIVKCEEAEKTISFSILSSKNIVEINMISTEQKSGKFNFAYLIRDKSSKNQEINIAFWLENADGVSVVEGTDSFSLKANEELLRQGILNLPGDAGQYILNIKLDSDGSIISFEEPVLIGSSVGLLGRVLLVAGGGKVLGIAIFVAILAFVVIYVLRRIIRKPLQEDRTGYVKIKLNEKH